MERGLLAERRERLDYSPWKNPLRRARSKLKETPRLERSQKSHGSVVAAILEQIESMRGKALDPAFMNSTGLVKDTAQARFASFSARLKLSLLSITGRSRESASTRQYFSLRSAFERGGPNGIEAQLRFMLQEHLANLDLQDGDVVDHANLADLRYPYEWYPSAREINRHIHLHIGPTNSGKTYHALKQLEQSSSGIYAGPLRLLAHEVYRRLNEKGKPCNLITGDEIIATEGVDAAMSSCTVEMVPVGRHMDVAVIDEIQMIGHVERGWAWTQALLGLCAKEIHLCGEDRALPLIKELSAAMGDTLHIHRYERLSPLEVMPTSLDGRLRSLQKGDCVVTFSRRGIHAMKQEIEKVTKKKVAVIYGSLPPDVRAQQARLFNDSGNDYDILVASDAVGMGLNLNIKRIIFESTSKFFSGGFVSLSQSEIKQIAGRAGRFRVATDVIGKPALIPPVTDASSKQAQAVPPKSPCYSSGLVTSLDRVDLPLIQRAMTSDASPILSAGILPPDDVLVRFATYFPPQTPFSYILLRLHEISRMHSRFHLCQPSDAVDIADAIQGIKGLSIHDRIVFCAAPASLNEPGHEKIIQAYARCVENQCGGNLLDFQELNLALIEQSGHGANFLRELEALHKALILYLWLSYRFNGIFVSQVMAFHVKKLVEDRIDQTLSGATYSTQSRQWAKRRRQAAVLQVLEEQRGVADVQVSHESASNQQATEILDGTPTGSSFDGGTGRYVLAGDHLHLA